MSVETVGIDHAYTDARDMGRSEAFYERVTGSLGFRKGDGNIGGDTHLFYFNRHFLYSPRPARDGTTDHDSYAPGLHHLCFRVVDEAAVDRAAGELRAVGVEVTDPSLPPRVRS